MHEARFWKTEGVRIRCQLCPHSCSISPLRRGICGVRENRDGKLYSMNYGKVSSANVDPIEKKPLFHFYPGESVFSIGSVGCTMRCRHCFVPGTFVVTSKGAHAIEEISSIDNYELLAHSGQFKEIKNVFNHHYSGDICLVKPRYLPEIKCTPEHQFLTSSHPSFTDIQKVEAQNLKKGDFVVIPKRKKSTGNPELDVKSILSNADVAPFKIHRKMNPELLHHVMEMRSSGLTIKQISTEVSLHRNTIGRNLSMAKCQDIDSLFEDIKCNLIEENNLVRFSCGHTSVPSKIEITPRLARLFGLYCAEGCVRKSRNRNNSYNTVFSFGHSEEGYAEEVKATCQDLFGAKVSISKEPTTLKVNIGGSILSILIKELCGSDCTSKKVPDFLFDSPREIVGAFLQGYFDGDGCYKKAYTDAITVSKPLAMGVCELLLNQGVVPAFYSFTPPERRLLLGREVKQRTEYIVRIPSTFDFVHGRWNREYKSFYFEDDHNYYVPIWSISKEPYEGQVHNFEVEGDHTYTANFAAVCNCQNYTISQASLSEFGTRDMKPEDVSEIALSYGSRGIAFTYNEPTIWHEFAYDAMGPAKEKGMFTVYVTNGFIQEAPLRELANRLDAMNIDIKGFTEKFYDKVCKTPLQPVLDATTIAHELGIHIELTYLIIPGENDDKEEIKKFSEWVVNLDPRVPVHFTRFHPDYQMLDKQPTPIKTMEMAQQLGKEAGLQFIYLGNVQLPHGEDTICPKCHHLIVERHGFGISNVEAKDGHCPICGQDLYMVQRKGEVVQSEAKRDRQLR
jgi:pyruvate formate lyase activating enzyme